MPVCMLLQGVLEAVLSSCPERFGPRRYEERVEQEFQPSDTKKDTRFIRCLHLFTNSNETKSSLCCFQISYWFLDQLSGRIADDGGVIRYIFYDHGACTDDHVITNCDPLPYD